MSEEIKEEENGAKEEEEEEEEEEENGAVINSSDAQLLARILSEDDEENESRLNNFSSIESYFSNGHIRFPKNSLFQPDSIIRLHYLSKGTGTVHGDLDDEELDILEDALLTDSEFDEDEYDCPPLFAEVDVGTPSSVEAEALIPGVEHWDLDHIARVHSEVKDLLVALRSEAIKVPALFLNGFLSISRSFLEGGRRHAVTALHPRATTVAANRPPSSLSSSRGGSNEIVFKYCVDLPWSSKVAGPRSPLRGAGSVPASCICIGPEDGSLLVGRESGAIAICSSSRTSSSSRRTSSSSSSSMVRDRHLWLQPSPSQAAASLSSPSRAAKSWAVSSMAILSDCARSFYLVLAGYSCGDVALWEVDKEPEQRAGGDRDSNPPTSSQPAPPLLPVKRWVGLHGSSVAWVQFLRSDLAASPAAPSSDDGQQAAVAVDAVSGDRRGFLHKLKIVRSANSSYSVEHVCLLDGTSGPLLSLATLPCAPSGHRGGALGGAQLLSFTLGSNSTSIVQLSPSLKILHKWPTLAGEHSAPMAWGWTWRSGGGLEYEARLLRGQGSTLESLILSASASASSGLPSSPLPPSTASSSDDTASSSRGFNLPFLGQGFSSQASSAAPAASIAAAAGPSINLQMPGMPADDSWKLMAVCWLRDHGDGDVGAAGSASPQAVCLTASWVVLLAVEDRALVVRHCCRTDPSPCAAPFFPAMLDGKVAAGKTGATFLLQSTVCSARLFTPIDIAEEHASEGRWLEALLVASSSSSSCSSGGPVREDERRRSTALLLDYLRLTLPSISLPPTSAAILLRHFSLLASSACAFCLRLDEQALLFGEVQQLFAAAGSAAHSAFLVSLEPLVLSQQLQSIPPDTLRDMMLEAEAAAHLPLPLQLSCRSLELCAVHLRYPLSVEGQGQQLLLQELSTFLLQRGLLAGYMYITASALGDFDGAWLGTMAHLQSPRGAEVSDPAAAASHLLLFLYFTFHNKCYPCGRSQDPSGSGHGRTSLLRLLLSSDPGFQQLRFLYRHDGQGLYFTLAQGLAVTSRTASSEGDVGFLSEAFSLLWKFSCAAEDGDASPAAADPAQLDGASAAARGLYFTHLRPVFCAESFSVPLDAQVLCAAIAFAASAAATASSSPGSGNGQWQWPWLQEEGALTDLLQRQHALEGSGATSPQVEALLRRLGFHSAALALDIKSRRLPSPESFSTALDFYLRLPSLRRLQSDEPEPEPGPHPAYRYLTQLLDWLLLLDLNLNGEEDRGSAAATVAAEAVLSRIAALHELLSPGDFQSLVSVYLCRCLTLTQLLQLPMSAPTGTSLQRDFLAALLSTESSAAPPSPLVLSSLPSADLLLLLEQLAAHDPSRVLPCLKQAAVWARVRGQGSCSIEPSQRIAADGQAMGKLRALCEQRKIHDGLAYLLQLCGQHDKALQALFDGFQSLLLQTKAAINRQLKSGDQSAALLAGSELLEVLCKEGREDACSRLPCHGQLRRLVDCIACLAEDAKHSDPDLWFKAFDFLLNQRQSVRQGFQSSAKELLAVLLGLSLRALLQHMKAAHISPQHIIRRITGQELGVRLGEFRDVLLSMLGAHSTDLAFSGAVGDSLRADLLRLCQRKTSAMRRAYYRSEDGLLSDAAADASMHSHGGLTAAARRRQQQVLRVSESALSADGFLPITALPTHLEMIADEQEARRPGSLPAKAATTAQFDRIQ